MLRSAVVAVTAGVLGALIWKVHRPPAADPVEVVTDKVLSDLATTPANLYYLSKPPWMIVPVGPFRPDNRDFPRKHRYRDPQGPVADIYRGV